MAIQKRTVISLNVWTAGSPVTLGDLQEFINTARTAGLDESTALHYAGSGSIEVALPEA
jgi:hypothetical protein